MTRSAQMVDRVAVEVGLFAVHVQTSCSSDWNSSNLIFLAIAENIVNILLENGADVTIGNRRRQTPLQMAHNIRVTRILTEAVKRYKV